jgi:hypothetical protein
MAAVTPVMLIAVSTVMSIHQPIFFVREPRRPVSGPCGGNGLKDGWT